jgi:acyl-CoA synthetase (AMP-forming)/AMP-acid ligase II
MAHGLGMKQGDKVAIAMKNFPEYMLAFVAITFMGGIVVPLNSLWKTDELKYACQDAGVKLIIGDAARLKLCEPFLDAGNIATILIRGGETGEPTGHNWPTRTWESVLADGQKQKPVRLTAKIDDEAMLMYTSGSTGFPKGVMHTHRSVGTLIRMIELGCILDPSLNGTLLLPVPLFHITGIAGIFLKSLSGGVKLVIMKKWDAGKALDLIEHEECAQFMGVPTMVRDMMEHPSFSEQRVKTLKTMATGGAPVPPTQLAQLESKAKNVSSGQAYGLTETIGATVITGKEYREHPKSCGKAVPLFCQVVIKNPETNKTLGVEERGEVCIKGPMVMKGYHNLPEKTAEVMDSEGFFHSGDIGRLDKDGYLYIMDRLKDLIIRGGENIDCSEVEAACYTLPAVRECSVFALPDERLGEVVGAAVFISEEGVSPADVTAAAAKVLAKFKVPAPENVFILTGELPKGATGKIDKKGLRARFSAVVEQRGVQAKL